MGFLPILTMMLGANQLYLSDFKVLANPQLSELFAASWCSSYWSTVAAAQNRSWPILTVFPVGRNSTCTQEDYKEIIELSFEFHTYKSSCWKAISLETARYLSHGLQRLYMYIEWGFSCSGRNSNWLLYWKEKPIRILHFAAPIYIPARSACLVACDTPVNAFQKHLTIFS